MEKITDEDLKEMLTKSAKVEEVKQNEFHVEIPNETISLAKEPVENTTITKMSSEELSSELDFNLVPNNIDSNIYSEHPIDPDLEKTKELSLGFSIPELNDIFKYVSGRGPRPDCMDRLMTDAEGRIKEMTLAMTLMQLSQLPAMTALRSQVTDRLFDPVNLSDMDSKVLSATMSNLNKSISTILESSIKMIQTMNQFGNANSKYRQIIDRVLQLPADQLDKMQEMFLQNIDEKKE